LRRRGGAGRRRARYLRGGGGRPRLCLALPARALVPVTAVCLGLFVVGVVGNILTVLVIRGCRDMKTTTNLYLGSMAVSDLLILLGLPFDLYRLWRSRPWIFGQLLCRLSHYLSEGCTYCTILHITALTVERYLAICFPLKAKVVVTKRRVKAVIGILWAFAFLSASPFFFLVDVEQPDNHTDFSRECKPTLQAVESGLLATMFWVTTFYFILPVICLNILYGFIGRELWRSNARLRGPNAVLREKGHRQTVKILGESLLQSPLGIWLGKAVVTSVVSSSGQQHPYLIFLEVFHSSPRSKSTGCPGRLKNSSLTLTSCLQTNHIIPKRFLLM
uniref:Motilin receptor n=1 Tax=Strix occidentalis caurina TaxID=311401 RepID=A0A8D0EP54_STROC